jgi:hypothetical protein
VIWIETVDGQAMRTSAVSTQGSRSMREAIDAALKSMSGGSPRNPAAAMTVEVGMLGAPMICT